MEYTRRMHRVLDHIDQHLDRTLELDELAQMAHFSPYHFHRLFSAWMGETLGDYLRRRRLEVAAMRLAAQPRLPVLNVALSVGFGSAEAFARAFKTRFGSTATVWRRQQAQQRTAQRQAADRKPDQVLRKPGQELPLRAAHDAGSTHAQAESAMKVKLIERQPVRVAYLRNYGPYGEALSAFWMNLAYPWMAANDLLGRARYGIGHDDPDITAAEKCRYDACVEVPADFSGNGRCQFATIPGGRYASHSFRGTAAQIGAAWEALLRDWLPASSLQLDARPCFEYYPVDAVYDAQSGAFGCDIVIPVVPL